MSEETPVNSLGANNIQGVQQDGSPVVQGTFAGCQVFDVDSDTCLLYTSDAADE